MAPSLRSTEVSGTRTTTCLTALWPRSIDWATSAVPVVAAAEPMATPTMVPLTPKPDAMTAASTAPAAEARIWRSENFTAGCVSRRATGATARAMNWRAPESSTQSCPKRATGAARREIEPEGGVAGASELCRQATHPPSVSSSSSVASPTTSPSTPRVHPDRRLDLHR